MTLDGLRCLCAVVEEGGFNAAALVLHRSQPAISQQIKTLEVEVGHTVLERRGGALTPMGRMLYARAKRLLIEADSLSREVQDFDETSERELRIGTSDTTALYVLPPLVKQFSEALPSCRFILINRNSADIAEQVLRGELDLGIVTLPTGHPGLDETELFTQRMLLAVPSTNPLSKKRKVQLAALAGVPMLLLDDQTRTGGLLQRHFQKQGFVPRAVMYSGSFEVIKRYIAEGIGCAILPETVIGPGDKRITTLAVPGLPVVQIGAIFRKGAYRAQAERTFLDMLRSIPM